jgi:hypothetical protein
MNEECAGARPGGPRDRWVVCDEYVAGPFTQARAEHELDETTRLAERFRLGCRNEHTIEISDTKPPVRHPVPWPEHAQ